MGPHPAVAAIRLAVRRVLHDVLTEHDRHAEQTAHAAFAEAGAGTGAGTGLRADGRGGRLRERPDRPLVLVACSGGADSMALASALAFESRKLPVRAGGITVDHNQIGRASCRERV